MGPSGCQPILVTLRASSEGSSGFPKGHGISFKGEMGDILGIRKRDIGTNVEYKFRTHPVRNMSKLNNSSLHPCGVVGGEQKTFPQCRGGSKVGFNSTPTWSYGLWSGLCGINSVYGGVYGYCKGLNTYCPAPVVLWPVVCFHSLIGAKV